MFIYSFLLHNTCQNPCGFFCSTLWGECTFKPKLGALLAEGSPQLLQGIASSNSSRFWSFRKHVTHMNITKPYQ